jgi:cobalt-zinc-cadmium efflux system outer membrane protein
VVRRRPPAGEPEPDRDDLHPEGLTLEEAICLLVRNNLDLRARFSDISQADSDVLTASLRANPILYADAQQVPYGSYSGGATGGPTQFDVNIVHPLDLSRKRQARTRAAVLTRQVVEALYRDAVRLAIDNLYGAYVDALSAQQQYDRATGLLSDDALSGVPIEEPTQGLRDTQRRLALLVNLPVAEVSRRQLRGRLAFPSDEEHLPAVPWSVEAALGNRPDLAAQRLAVCVADANVKAVLANRLDDLLLLYQPFTAKSGTPFGQPNGFAWAVGLTVPLPLYNRQQGNLMKARQIADQARTRLVAAEQAVASEVQGAYLEHEAAHAAWVRTLKDFKDFKTRKAHLARGLDVDDELRARLQALEEQFNDLLDDAYYDKLNKCYASIIRHRMSQLRLNTVVAVRVVEP